MSTRLERLVALLLRCGRDPYDAMHAADVLQLFRERAAAARGRPGWSRFLVRELGSLLAAAAAEQGRHLVRTPRVFAREGRHAARRLTSAPSFTLASVATVAATLGALAVVFTLVHRIILSPLPYPGGDRLIDLDHGAPGVGIASDLGMSIGLYHQYSTLGSLESVAIYYVGERTLSHGGDAANTEFMHTTPSLSRVLQVQPAIGRWFTEAEGAPGGTKVIVLTDGFWRRRFGGDPGVLGTAVGVDGVPHQIVGVMPPGFAYPDPRVEFIAALQLPPRVNRAAGFNYEGIARLAPGAALDTALDQQRAVLADLPNRYPGDPEIASGLLRTSGLHPITGPLKAKVLGGVEAILWILLAAAAAVAVMACANLANLFFVRADAQRADAVLRGALGADGLALAAYRLGESFLVVIAGAVLALPLAGAGLRLLVASDAVSLPRLHEVRVDSTALLFVAAGAAIVWILLATSTMLHHWMSGGGTLHLRQRQAAGGGTAMRVRRGLIAGQVALALVLLASAGLLGRSFSHLVRADPGFRTEDRLVFRIGLPGASFRDRAGAAVWHEQLLERLRTLHGVRSAAASSTIPLTVEGQKDPIEVFGRPAVTPSLPVVRFTRVSPGFFATLEIAVRSGRVFDGADARGAADSVVINEAAARLYFGDGNPLGARIRPLGQQGDRWLTIVGVIADTATSGVQEREPLARLYVPLAASLWADVPGPHEMTYVLRTDGSPLAAAPLVRELVRSTNPELALAGVERYADIAARSRAGISLAAVLIATAAAVALFLGVVGVYAVVAYAVTLKRTEIAVRLAVGATPQQVMRQQVWQGSLPIALGVATGIVAAALASRSLQALLFGVTPHDPATYLAACALLLAVAVLACWWPARRAAHASPIDALRG